MSIEEQILKEIENCQNLPLQERVNQLKKLLDSSKKSIEAINSALSAATSAVEAETHEEFLLLSKSKRGNWRRAKMNVHFNDAQNVYSCYLPSENPFANCSIETCRTMEPACICMFVSTFAKFSDIEDYNQQKESFLSRVKQMIESNAAYKVDVEHEKNDTILFVKGSDSFANRIVAIFDAIYQYSQEIQAS